MLTSCDNLNQYILELLHTVVKNENKFNNITINKTRNEALQFALTKGNT